MNSYQIFLPIASALYFLLVFVLRSYILWRQTGVNPFVFGKTEKAHDYIGSAYKLMTAGTWVSIILFSFFPHQYGYLLPIWYLDIESIRIVGVILVVVSFIWTSISQYQMSKSWRIGIDYSEKTALIHNGLFKHSRNPIFLGVIVSYLATFLIAPNALSFALMLLTYLTIQFQVRLEEEYLLSMHDQHYVDYTNSVNRWL